MSGDAMQKISCLKEIQKKENSIYIGDKELDLYLTGKANFAMCKKIELDSEYLEWNKNTASTPQNIKRAERIMKNIF